MRFQVVSQLAELVSTLEKEHGLLGKEPSAGDALPFRAESLRKRPTKNLDLQEARDVVANDVYREAAVDCLCTAGRKRPPDSA